MSINVCIVSRRMTAKIQCVWRDNPDSVSFSLDDMATELKISRRTLQRKLKEENTSYLTLQDDARLDLTRYFLSAGKSVEEVSCFLGFANRRCFTRAFKRWTGKSPSLYKK